MYLRLTKTEKTILFASHLIPAWCFPFGCITMPTAALPRGKRQWSSPPCSIHTLTTKIPQNCSSPKCTGSHGCRTAQGANLGTWRGIRLSPPGRCDVHKEWNKGNWREDRAGGSLSSTPQMLLCVHIKTFSSITEMAAVRDQATSPAHPSSRVTPDHPPHTAREASNNTITPI